MKFPRNARVFRGQLDAAPFATVFFLLVIFIMLGSLTYTPGVRIRLPIANDLPGTEKSTVSVAIDATGRLYYQNQWIEEPELLARLRTVVKTSSEPLTLVVQADQSVTEEMLLRLTLLAHQAGISDAMLATRPNPFGNAAPSTQP